MHPLPVLKPACSSGTYDVGGKAGLNSHEGGQSRGLEEQSSPEQKDVRGLSNLTPEDLFSISLKNQTSALGDSIKIDQKQESNDDTTHKSDGFILVDNMSQAPADEVHIPQHLKSEVPRIEDFTRVSHVQKDYDSKHKPAAFISFDSKREVPKAEVNIPGNSMTSNPEPESIRTSDTYKSNADKTEVPTSINSVSDVPDCSSKPNVVWKFNESVFRREKYANKSWKRNGARRFNHSDIPE
ncbi:unnamed protein product [Nezara viridula]|uniref:Uncharacterized protein n=1 Tax=Nezara viridula TaxID=85310 RepID=A0A9P0HEE6_NEZVI|nr:unnamed protein product [Nezara viridula]